MYRLVSCFMVVEFKVAVEKGTSKAGFYGSCYLGIHFSHPKLTNKFQVVYDTNLDVGPPIIHSELLTGNRGGICEVTPHAVLLLLHGGPPTSGADKRLKSII